jgi:signal transduction histidine kinase/ligand-binding sensor domain-containing protein/DNA-binding response OmpR family regulator
MKIYLYFTFSVFLFTSSASAYNVRQISNKDGLSNSAILSIYQDDDGFMWFGSCDGLNLFDGSNISVYKSPEGKNNLSGNLIEDILETESGIFWLQTNYGLNKLDKKKRHVDYFPYFDGSILLRKDRENVLFILNEDNCLYYYDKKINSILKIATPGLVAADVLDYNINKNNELCVFFKDGRFASYSIVKKEDSAISLLPLQTGKLSASLLFCSYEEDTVYYIDDTYTLFEYDLPKNKKSYVYNLKKVILENGTVSSIIKNKNNYFIGFKTNGLIYLKNIPEKSERYQIEEIDIKAGIFCLYKDRNQDIVWVGTDGQGVYLCFSDSYFIHSSTFNNIPYNIEKPVRALFLDKENTLWIGTKGDGLLKLYDYDKKRSIADGKMEHIHPANSHLSNNSVYAFAKSNKNILWIGHDDGLNYYSYRDKQIKTIALNRNGLPLKYIHSICEINDSSLWLASVGMGIIHARIAGTDDKPVLTDVEQYTTHDGLLNANHFFTVLAENDTCIWLGNRGYGAFKINPQTAQLTSIQFDQNHNNQLLNDVFSLQKDNSGNLWCGTSFGLVKYTPTGNISVFNEKSGFPNNSIHGILKDTENNFWLSTNRGIIRFDIENETFQAYDKSSGLKVTEFSDGAFFKEEKTGDLFFGGIDGFVVINDANDEIKEYMPPVYFNSLTIFGLEYNIFDFLSQKNGKEMLELSYNQNFFSISFSVNDYINANNYLYFYKLNELSEQWIENNESKIISFTNISPGKYTLFVKYKNRVTGKESDVYPIILNIRPPWYFSTLAYIAYLLLALTGILLLTLHFIRKNQKKRREMLEKMQQKHQEEVHESKLRFFTNIAHEFCTPLTLIYGPCNRILDHKGSDKFVIEYTRLIQRNAERLNSLIQELIEFRRIETGHRKPRIEQIVITDFAHEIFKSFSETMESKNFRFEHYIQQSLVWNSDKSFLYTVITNLISNALKYTNDNGSIKLSVKKGNNMLLITISNTGKGIKKENFDRVFDRYSILDNFENRNENTVTRNGLGLAISNNLVHLLGGTIEIDSIPNQLTSFTIKLPEQEISPASNSNLILPKISIGQDYKTNLELPDYKFDWNKQTVVVIDDDIEILWLICEAFVESYNVFPVSKITNVDEIFKDISPDIIICDVTMPEISGITFTKRLKSNKKTAHIPMILVSAKNNIDEQIQGLDAGAEMYITKPFNIDYLKISVKQLISRKQTLKNYFASPLSAFDVIDGKMMHKENKQFFQKLLDIINNNLMEKNLSPLWIASQLNISPRHLHRKTREICGQSVSDMIKECRLAIAQNLLINTKMTIDEIIIHSGFTHRTTFYNVFAEKYNCTPKEYREKATQI